MMALDVRAVVVARESSDVVRIDVQTPVMNGDEHFVSGGERFTASALRAH